jgi:hypothetical protein
MSIDTPLKALHAELQRREIVLQMDGPKLIAVDPLHRLSPALDETIRTYRDELVAVLNPVSAALGPLQEAVDKARVGTDLDPVMEATDLAFQRGEITQEEAKALAPAATEKSRQIPASVEEMSLADFATSGLIRKAESKVLGETVLWAADNAEVDPEMDLVAYRAYELKELDGMPPEQLRCIHVFKKTREWEVILPEDSEKYQMVPADQLLDSHAFGSGKTCWACGGQDWWDKAGRPICAKCHPYPKLSKQERNGSL